MGMMTKRLQEIKADIKRGRKYDIPNDWDCGYEGIYDVMDELVAFLEAVQAELAEAEADLAAWRGWHPTNAELRKQLAEAQDDRDKAIAREATEYAKQQKKIDGLYADNNRDGREIERLYKKLTKSQAEVSRLRALPHDEIILLEDKLDK